MSHFNFLILLKTKCTKCSGKGKIKKEMHDYTGNRPYLYMDYVSCNHCRSKGHVGF